MNMVTKAGTMVPDHVPPHLVWDWQIQDYTAQEGRDHERRREFAQNAG